MTAPLRRRAQSFESAFVSCVTIVSAGSTCLSRSASVASRMRFRSSMLNRQVRSPSWMPDRSRAARRCRESTSGPPRSPSGDAVVALARHDRFGRAGRTQHNVGARQQLIESLPGHRLAAATSGHGHGLFGTAIGDPDTPRLQLPQVTQCQFAHLAGADDEDGLVAEVVEHLLDVIDGGTGDGRRGRAQMPVSVRTRRATCRAWRNSACNSGPTLSCAHGLLVGFFHLPGDLPLADDHAVEAGGDAEQMPHRLGLTMTVQMRTDGGRGQAVKVGEELGDGSRRPIARQALRIVEDAADIQLDAIAGAEDDGLAIELRSRSASRARGR